MKIKIWIHRKGDDIYFTPLLGYSPKFKALMIAWLCCGIVITFIRKPNNF